MRCRAVLPFLISLAAAPPICAEDAAALWSRKVQPLFDVQCVKCHGPLEQKGGLELDTPEAVLKGGDDGAVVVPGKPADSPLYLHLAADADPPMPPKKQLTEIERTAIRDWIAAMASAPATPRAKQVESRNFDSVTQAVDTLIAEGWEGRGVKPAPAASERTWCRRVYLDLA